MKIPITTMIITSLLVTMFAITGATESAKASTIPDPYIYPEQPDPNLDPDPITPQVTPDPNDPTQVPITQEEMDQAIEDSTNEILTNAPSATEVAQENSTYPSESITLETETGIQYLSPYSIGVKLIKIFGKRYVTTVLPKYIYKHLPYLATKHFSESAFVNFWSTYVLIGALDSVHTTVSKWVDKYTWHWVAESAGYIVQGIVWAII